MDNEKIFDEVADHYDDLLRQDLSAYGKSISYYSEYKVRLTCRNTGLIEPRRILEFGCGTGRNIKFLKKYFPNAHITGSDISPRSLRQARDDKNNAGVDFVDVNELVKGRELYDLIFVAVVLHHIVPAERERALARLHGLLAQNGEIFIFEHNPYNPLTVKAVKECPFDEGVVLVKPNELIGLSLRVGLRLVEKQYYLFFPSGLKSFSFLERFVHFVPLGGQYFVKLVKI